MRQAATKILIVGSVTLATFGIAAPSFAATRSGTMTNWTEGDASGSWHDSNNSTTKTDVLFYATCKHDFTARIRKENFTWDDTVASERINCTSYDDAVVGKDFAADDYHFDVQEHSIVGGNVYYPYLSGTYRITW